MATGLNKGILQLVYNISLEIQLPNIGHIYSVECTINNFQGSANLCIFVFKSPNWIGWRLKCPFF